MTRPFHHSSTQAMIDPPATERDSQPSTQVTAFFSMPSMRDITQSACEVSSSTPIMFGLGSLLHGTPISASDSVSASHLGALML